MDTTLTNYLRVLHTPNGAPEEGSVDWDKTDLLGTGTHVRVEWSRDYLVVKGATEIGEWKLEARRGEQGWDAEETTQGVGGGTLLAKVRWAGKQVDEIALGAHPQTSWDVPRKSSRRGMKP